MEASLQKIVAMIVGVLILFIIPVYVAYEKVDDVSYSLVLKMTQSFVDNVREKGYVSPEMYNDYMSNIYTTNNSYDVKIEHLKKRYDPVIYIYDKETKKQVEVLDYDKYIGDVREGNPITINKGIYNEYNSIIDVVKPSIKLTGEKGINDIEGYESYTDEQLYKEKIDQLEEEKRIRLSDGEVYADASKILESDWDDKIYIPSIMSTFNGAIHITNPQGNEERNLDYNKYIKEYDGQKSLTGPNGIVGQYLNGPTYTNVKNVQGILRIKGENTSDEVAKYLYDRWASTYHNELTADDGRMVFGLGEIYADRDKMQELGILSAYDSELYINSDISFTGNIKVKDPGVWEPDSISFKDYEKALKDTGSATYDMGGIYPAARTTGTIGLKNGYILEDDAYQKYEEKMRDTSSNKIKVNIVETYDNNENSGSVSFSDDSKVIVTATETWLEDGVEKTTSTSLQKKIETIEEYKDFKKSLEETNTVTINGITYSNNYSNEKESGRYEIITYSIEIVEPSVIILSGQMSSDRIVSGVEMSDGAQIEGESVTVQKCLDYYMLNNKITVIREEETDKKNIDIQYESLSYNKNEEYITYYEYENKTQYATYLSQYMTDSNGDGVADNMIEIEPIIYTLSDIDITYETIKIVYNDEKNGDTVKTIESDNSKFSQYKNEFDTTGIITIESSNTQSIDNIEIQDPHIVLTSGEGSIDIYKYNYQNKSGRRVNEWLYNRYTNEYANNGKVTTLYNVNDVYVQRAYIRITTFADYQTAKHNDATKMVGVQTIYDNNPLYKQYRNEYETDNPGFVTAEGAIIYRSEQLEVTKPVITIRNADTGEIIEQYVPDYTKSDEDGRYNIYENKLGKYETNNQIINQEQVTYTTENYDFETGHAINYERITDRQIVNKLFYGTSITKEQYFQDCMLGNFDSYSYLGYINENSYTMNEGDQIIVTVGNTNKTIAGVFYGLFTANVGLEDVAKVYVNYGGTINNSGKTLLTDANGTLNSKTGRIFKYRGYAEEVTLDKGVYEIECWGASGGGNDESGGKGAYVFARYEIKDTTNLYVYVGGKGTMYSGINEDNGGWNRWRKII